MKKIIVLIFTLSCSKSFAQKAFTDCAAAFLNNKMMVKEYSNKAKASISMSAKGELSVGTVALSEKGNKLMDNFVFSIAIKDKATGTLMLFSKENYTKINIQKVLSRCHKGDSIMILTLSNEYALPHNEILVN
ncbi:MAG: hypothetical protein U5N85_10550 [Arcicella sp.]|nr:hypothetical protein [Arcicella sp.]